MGNLGDSSPKCQWVLTRGPGASKGITSTFSLTSSMCIYLATWRWYFQRYPCVISRPSSETQMCDLDSLVASQIKSCLSPLSINMYCTVVVCSYLATGVRRYKLHPLPLGRSQYYGSELKQQAMNGMRMSVRWSSTECRLISEDSGKQREGLPGEAELPKSVGQYQETTSLPVNKCLGFSTSWCLQYLVALF